MKKARKVFIKDEITAEEYEELLQHAKNSALWYQTNFFKNSNQIREKLYDKGFPKHPTLITDGTERDFVEETIKFLDEMAFLDDEYYVENLVQELMEKGKGINYIKQKAWERKVETEDLEEVLNRTEFRELYKESFEKAESRIKASSSYLTREEDWRKKQFLTQRLMQTGFTYGDISTYLTEEE